MLIASACASKAPDPVSSIPMRGPVSLQVPGFLHQAQLYVHDERDTVIAPALLRDRCWERDESELLCRLLKPGDSVLDVGANIGYFTVLAAVCVGEAGQVWAFEPEPLNAQLLGRNLHLNGLSNVHLVQAALGKETGEASLFLSENNAGDHSLAAAVKGESIPVSVVRGDAVLPEGLRVNVIKMDVQGAEPVVLMGLESLIARSLPDVRILLEFCPAAMDRVEAGSAEYLLKCLQRWDLPVYVVDQWQHAVVETTIPYLQDWLHACRDQPGDEGFFNLLVGEPPEDFRRLAACGC